MKRSTSWWIGTGAASLGFAALLAFGVPVFAGVAALCRAAANNVPLFLAVFGLGGLGLGLRRAPGSPVARTLAPLCLILAGSALPHLLFVLLFSLSVAPDGAEPAALPALARAYESVAVWLYLHVRPWLALPLLASILLGLLLVWAARRFEAPRLIRPLQLYRKWGERATLALIGATAFTLFSTAPSGAWSPDLPVRLQAQLRLATEYRVDEALALAAAGQAEADPLVLLGAIREGGSAAGGAVSAAIAQDALVARSLPYDPYRGAVSVDALVDAAVAATAEGMAARDRAAMLAVAPSPDAAPPARAPRAATLAEVRAAAAQARQAETLAGVAQEEAKGRIAQALGEVAGAALAQAGLEPLSGLGRTLLDAYLDALFEKAGAALVARAIERGAGLPAIRARVAAIAGRAAALARGRWSALPLSVGEQRRLAEHVQRHTQAAAARAVRSSAATRGRRGSVPGHR